MYSWAPVILYENQLLQLKTRTLGTMICKAHFMGQVDALQHCNDLLPAQTMKTTFIAKQNYICGHPALQYQRRSSELGRGKTGLGRYKQIQPAECSAIYLA
jgi:hypothetical protein